MSVSVIHCLIERAEKQNRNYENLLQAGKFLSYWARTRIRKQDQLHMSPWLNESQKQAGRVKWQDVA